MPLEKSEASTSGSEFPFSEEDEIMEVVVDQEEDDDDVVLVETRSHKPGSAASTTTVADIGRFKDVPLYVIIDIFYNVERQGGV